MKSAWRALLSTGILSCSLAIALAANTATDDPAAPPPIPPKVQGDQLEPSVIISEREGERVEEYTQNGHVYMVKITPIRGPAYYYFDLDGDGRLELSANDKKLNPVQPVFWKLKEW